MYPGETYQIQMLGTGADPRKLSTLQLQEVGRVFAGACPLIIRKVIGMATTSAFAAAAVVSFRTATGWKTSTTGNQFDTLTFATAMAQGRVLYSVPASKTTIRVGEGVAAVVTTGATGESVELFLEVEQSPEEPGNAPNMDAA